MAQFRDEQQVYASVGRLLRDIVADERIGGRLQRADAVVQYQFRRPDAAVTLKLVEGEEREVVFGATDLRPEVVLVMDAATGHRLWLGELSLMTGLNKGLVRAKGPVGKILLLVPPIADAVPRYRELLAEGFAATEEPAAEEPAAEEPAAEEPAAEAADVSLPERSQGAAHPADI